ncbi:flagellin N-terminal helical domain-containing protein [Vogesella indigofera]|uniref:flagellin N-terminal helical domain-containing protein n=1 Tax=Vogesella indigofera TaxID=45465 RepID=UPI00234E4C61|nr:flagellin [Vogesella indigofera]MDC7706149.1 flagellin [Vogesella indigofera]
MLSLHTNAAALFTKSNLSTTQSGLTTAMTRLGTGYRINSAMDDAAGLQIATRLEAQSRGMTTAMKNTQNGISMLQTADGALSEVSNILLRMKDLATEGANATANADDLKAMKSEYDALGAEMKNILDNTSFGGSPLLVGGKLAATGGVNFQIGASDTEVMNLDLEATLETGGTLEAALKLTSKGYDTTGVDLTATTANGAIKTLSDALTEVSTLRSTLGASANRLNHVYNNLANVNNNTQMAKSRIMDTDYAAETASMTSKQMLLQAGTGMLKQSGSIGQLAMSLMQ